MSNFNNGRVNGICCDCGDIGLEEETACPVREDGIHCVHWWETDTHEHASNQIIS